MVASSFIGATKEHPLIKKAVLTLKNNAKERMKLQPWRATGPMIYTEILEQMSIGQLTKWNTGIYPYYYFNPIHFSQSLDDVEKYIQETDPISYNFYGTTRNNYRQGDYHTIDMIDVGCHNIFYKN